MLALNRKIYSLIHIDFREFGLIGLSILELGFNEGKFFFDQINQGK